MRQFQTVPTNRPGRSLFDLSYVNKLTGDMGYLIPIMCDESVPGDSWDIHAECVIRFQPQVAPILHRVDLYVHYYYVPYRLLWEDWEEFITGGEDGTNSDTLPTWIPSSAAVTAEETLWDYLGFPTGTDPDGAYPLDFPRRAYNMIYNQYYRQEELIPEVALTDENLKIRAWSKDYFTSAQPDQQKGVAGALPVTISGTGVAEWATGDFNDTTTVPSRLGFNASPGYPQLYIDGDVGSELTNAVNFFNANEVDFSAATATTFDVADLRLAFQIQRWQELNQRAGNRYVEFLRAHFSCGPRDERLQRAEYIGGIKSNVIFSEVLQTSESDGTPQGTMAGHGIAVATQNAARYFSNEFGLIMGILSVMPRPAYQQGINRQWLRETRYDFYFPEFANLSEQQILRREIYATDVAADNIEPFGFQGQYDEMRVKHDQVHGQFRTTYNYWHLGRIFGSAPELNQTFLECVPRKDFLAAPSEPAMLINFGNMIKCARPMPLQANPGLVDHV